MKRRIFSILVALAMIVGMLPTVAFAQGTVTLDSTLDLTTYSGSGTETGYTWDGSTLTLTDDLTINTESGNGITLPTTGGTIDLAGFDLTIDAEKYGIYSEEGDIAIINGGNVDITSDDDGILAYEGAITIATNTIEVDADGYGISADGGAVDITGDVTVTATDGDGIYADGYVTIIGDVDVTAVGDGISSNGDVLIEGDVKMTDDNGGSGRGIRSSGSTIIVGDVDIAVSGNLGGIYANGNITITGDTVNCTAPIATSSTISITATTKNVLIESGNTLTVYGNVEVGDGLISYLDDETISFDVGATLTIPEGVTLDLTDCTLDTTGGFVEVYGTLVLAATLDDYSAFSGSGIIQVEGTNYDTNGNVAYGALDFTDDEAIPTGTTFSWNSETNTLTIRDDMAVVADEAGEKGITLPSGGATIEVDDDATLTIYADQEGIYAYEGDITITGGTINITAHNDCAGIYADGGSITITDGTFDIDAKSYGIIASNGVSISDSTIDITSDLLGIYTTSGDIGITSSTIEIDAGSWGIYADDGDITISGSADVNVKTTGNGANAIEAIGGDIEISGSANVTVNAKGNNADGIRANGNDIAITTTGKVTVYAAGFGINTNDSGGSITIKDATVVNTSVSSINSPTITIGDNAKVSSTSKLALGTTSSDPVAGKFTLEDATLNAVVAVVNKNEDGSYTEEYIVHGDVVVTSTLHGVTLFSTGCALDFAKNSTLTINEGVALRLVSYTKIEWNDATVTNNGIIYLNDEDYYSSENGETADEDTKTNIASLNNITGDGYIARIGTIESQLENKTYETVGVCSNEGTVVDYVVNKLDEGTAGDVLITLGETPVENEYYTWTVAGDVGTLTINDDLIINNGIEFEDVSSVNIVANGKLTIAGYGAEDNLTVSGNLTITGDLVVTGYIWIDGDLTVNGNLVAGAVFADSMEVPTDSTVNLLGAKFDGDTSTYFEYNKTYALGLTGVDNALTLGDNVSILTSGVTYAIGKYSNGINGGTFINEGETPDFGASWYNIASTVSIGKTPIISTSRPSTTTTTTTTTTATTTNDDGSVTATATTSTTTSGTTVTATVTDSNVDTAIENAVEAADGETAIVEIAVTTKDSTDTVSATISPDAMTAIADSDVDALVVTSDLGTVEIPSDALASIVSQATGTTVTITLELVDSSVLTQTQQTAVGDAQVYDLHITSGGEKITTFGGAEITVTLPYELAEDESAEHIVIWYLGDDGSMEALEGTYDEETGTATFATPHFSYYVAFHHNNPFEDVDLDDYFFSPVMWAVENEITNGTTDTTFSPDATCTRAQAVTLLWKAYGSPVVDYINPFTDVSSDAYYYEAVLWAVSEGITAGTSDTTFSPDADCTRGQIVTFLYRAAGEPEVTYGTGFSDVASTDYFYSAVLWAVNNSITNGTSDTTFSPNSDCTRGQIVTFLYRNLAE